MRKIKFRAWNMATKMMIDLKKITPLALNIDTDGIFIPFSDGLPLMQFTGLKDKNGAEIYEGDIVEAESIMTDKIYPFEVTFVDGCYWMAKYEPLFKSNNIVNNEWKNLKVIGNIYDNPELLEVVKQNDN